MTSFPWPAIDHLQPKLCATRWAVVLQHVDCSPCPARIDRCAAAVHPPIALVALDRKSLVIYNHTAHRAASLAHRCHVADHRFYDACHFFAAHQCFPALLRRQALYFVHHPPRCALHFTLLAGKRSLVLLVERNGAERSYLKHVAELNAWLSADLPAHV